MTHDPSGDTPALDAYLAPGQIRRLKGTEMQAFVRDSFAMARVEDAPSLDEDDHPARVFVVWRVARATALVKGLCAEDETLDEATDIMPSPWVTPFKPVMSPSAQAALRRERAAKLLIYHAAGDGLPLLPPRERGDALDRWCLAAALVVKDLGIERSRQGLRGIKGLLTPASAWRCDVTSNEVIALEELMMAEVQELYLDKGERVTLNHFHDVYSMARRECQLLLRLVKSQALKQTNASVEEKRALQERRLENYLARCKETMDMDGEMKALKELAKIQGLTRTDPENTAKEFFEIVKRVSARQDQELLDPRTLQMLNGRAENSEPITLLPAPPDPDDDEAIAEYDRENQHR